LKGGIRLKKVYDLEALEILGESIFNEDVYILDFEENPLYPKYIKLLEKYNDCWQILYSLNDPELEYYIGNYYLYKYYESLRMKNINFVKLKEDKYKGYKEIKYYHPLLENFYLDTHYNWFDLYVNEYLIIYGDNDSYEIYCWTGEEHRRVNYLNFNSDMFGDIRPMKNDPYQVIAMDSLAHNQLTMLTGPAGSAKSTLALAYLFNALEHNVIDKIIVFANPVAAKNAVHLGFYPGDRDTKLLDAQIGNFLRSKLGGDMMVDKLIENNQLEILPMSDIRGYQSPPNSAIYITESQNFDRYLMKLALQRLSEDSIMIVEGDNYQTDSEVYEGNRNGMKRLSEVFRGEEIFGQVELKNVHRSKVAKIAMRM
jgi:predicted ribonuclease YlaK